MEPVSPNRLKGVCRGIGLGALPMNTGWSTKSFLINWLLSPAKIIINNPHLSLTQRRKDKAALENYCRIEGLYKSLAPGSNPAFGTVVKTLDNLGFRLNIELKHAS